MTSSNHRPQNFVPVFAQLVKAIIKYLIWGLIGFASIMTAYVVVRIVLVAVKEIFNALGI